MMPLQRACAAESRVRNKSANGPWRVRAKALVFWHLQVVRNVLTYVSCRGYDRIS